MEWLVRPASRVRRFPSELLLPLAAATAFTLAWFAWAGKGTSLASDPNGAVPYLRQLVMADPHQPDLGFVSPFTFAARILGNLTIQASHAAELLTQIPWLKARWFSPFAVTVVAITVTGWWAAMSRPSRFGAWYFLGYAAILSLWPYDEGARFLVPVLPLLWLYSIDGVRQAIAAASAGSRRLRRAVLAVGSVCLLGAAISFLARPAAFSRQDQAFTLGWLAILGIAAFGWDRAAATVAALSRRAGKKLMMIAVAGYAVVGLIRIVPERLAQFRGGALADPVAESLDEASRWIIDSTPPGATIQATFPTQIQFATGRSTVRFPITGSAELLRSYAEAYRPNFLVVLRSDTSGYYRPVDSVKFVVVQGLFPETWVPAGRLSGSTIYASRSNPAVTRP